MIGKWFVDGIDIYKEFGIEIQESGFNDLFLFAALLTPYTNDWPEQNGIQVNLNDPKLKNKEVAISFMSITEDNIQVDNFLSFITKGGYRDLEIKSLGRVFSLRVSTENNRIVYRNGQDFTIKFIDDFPRGQLFETISVWGDDNNNIIASEDSQYAILVEGAGIPISPMGHGFSNLLKSAYQLDGIRFDEYGIVVEQGRAEVYKMPALKENLSRNINGKDSVIYDADFVCFQSKDVTLKCALYCDTIERFWSNYMAFFSDLINPKERLLTVDYANDTYPCFYKNMTNPIFYRGEGYVLLKFELVLTFTQFEPMKTIYVWGTHDNKIIVTEDGLNAIKYEI